MAEATYSKLDIAREYLDTAMRLYVEERNHFSVIHLAAAAEELFGQHLPEDERISTIALKAQISFDILEAGREVDYEVAHDPQSEQHHRATKIMRWSKNRVKHMDVKKENDHTIAIDPVAAARRWIEDALINFNTLRKKEAYTSRLPKSVAMWK